MTNNVDIKSIVETNLKNAVERDKLAEGVKKSKYGLFAVSNNAVAGKHLWAYWMAALVEAGVLDENGKRTGRGGKVQWLQEVCTPAKRAIKYHGERGNIREKNGSVFINDCYLPTVQQRFEKYPAYIKQFRHFMRTGEIGDLIRGAEGAKISQRKV